MRVHKIDWGVNQVPNFTLQGPDAFLFEIDPTTGEITLKSWFTPDFNDAWDVTKITPMN